MVYQVDDGDENSLLCLECIAFCFENVLYVRVLFGPLAGSCHECRPPASAKRMAPRQLDRSAALFLPSAMTQPVTGSSH